LINQPLAYARGTVPSSMKEAQKLNGKPYYAPRRLPKGKEQK
jgi:hypothetical protein